MAGITYEGEFRAETATGMVLRWAATVIYCKPSSPLQDYARFEMQLNLKKINHVHSSRFLLA